MKKLTLLGTLLVLGTMTQANEQTREFTQSEIDTIIRQVIEERKDIIELVKKSREFKPSLETKTELRLYGEETDKKGEYARLENRLILNATEKTSLDLRLRNYGAMDTERKTRNNNEVRARFYYDHNDYITSRLQYQTKRTDEHSFQYQPRIDLKNLFNVNTNLLTKMVLAPSITHFEDNHDYFNQANIDFELYGNLPLGFEWEVNTYYGNAKAKTTDNFGFGLTQEGEQLDKQQELTVELYLYHTLPLYKNESLAISLKNELGYEYYNTLKNSYDEDLNKEDLEEKFAYLETMLHVDKNINNNIDVFGGIGVKIANFEDRTKVSDFKTQPQVYLGFSTKW